MQEITKTGSEERIHTRNRDYKIKQETEHRVGKHATQRQHMYKHKHKEEIMKLNI